MSEEEESKEEEKPKTKKEIKEDDKLAETKELIDETNKAADRLDEANKLKTELMRQEERLRTDKLLAGKADAGTEPKEETPAEYKDRVLKDGYKAT